MIAFVLALAACNGEIVNSIDVRVHPPLTTSVAGDVLERASEMTGVHFATTRARIVRTYLLLREGLPCTERDRAESERILRSQTFIASAAIYVIPEGPGRVSLQVEVVDEFPILFGGSISRGSLASATLGSQNLGGRGLLAAVRLSRGFAYRTGFGVRLTQYGAFGRPALVALDAEREQHGDRLRLEVAQPFLTDRQRNAFHFSSGGASTLATLMSTTGAEVALYTRRASWDAGFARRLGTAVPGRTVGILGAAIMGEDIRVGDDVVIVSRAGLVPAPDSALVTRYHAFGVARVAAIGGVRQLRYLTVRGVDAVRAEQDVGIGMQLGALVGPSVWASRGASDLFIATDFYAGGGGESSFFTTRILAEARGNHESRRWDGVVASARFIWYNRASDHWSTTASLEGSTLQHVAFPAQLSFRDADGGVRGFGDADAAGGQRAVARIEQRIRFPQASVPVDLAAALFADAGKLWAGTAPYGVTTPVRSALGVSILGAYPSGGKRTYRLDVAFPLNPEGGRTKLEVRFSSSDRTVGVSAEPRDVARNRTGATPATLLKW